MRAGARLHSTGSLCGHRAPPYDAPPMRASPDSPQRRLGATIRRDALRFLDPHCAKPLTARRLALLAISPEFRLVAQFRMYTWLAERGAAWPARLLYAGTRARTACDLALGARIG